MLLLVAFLLALLILYYVMRYDKFWKHIMKIPGPKGMPILGNYYTNYTEEQLWLRDRKYARIFYPLYKLWCLEYAFVFMMCPEDIEIVLTNKAHLQKSFVYNYFTDWLGHGIFTSNAKKWHKRRKLLTPAYHFNILQKSVNVFNAGINRIVEHVKTKQCQTSYINVIEMATDYAMYCIGETSVGLSMQNLNNYEKYRTALKEYSTNICTKISNPLLYIQSYCIWSSVYKKERKIIDVLHGFSQNVLNEKKKQMQEDVGYLNEKSPGLVDLLLKAKENGADIDDTEIREEVDTFVFAGHETTASTLTFLLFILGNKPEVQEKIYEEILSVVGDSEEPTFNQLQELKYTERCIKETLRLYPVAPIIIRVAGEDIKTKSGHIIPKGCNIVISIYEVQRTSEVWENPEDFEPDRFLPENCVKRNNFAFIPFSAGSRNCIGQKFALVELKAAVCGIIRHFKLEAKEKLEDIKITATFLLKINNEELKVTFIPRA